MALSLYALWVIVTTSWVWLALAPLSSTAPEWLARTREVCFGSLNNGLPDTYGWISLAAPIPMLLALLILMGSELGKQARATSQRAGGRALVACLLLLPWGCLGYCLERIASAPKWDTPEAGPLPTNYPRIFQQLPEFELEDQFGHKVGPKQLEDGGVTFLTFAYAHCETVCPALLDNLRRAARQTGCRVVVITLDPRRDTCGSLTGLARHWKLPENTILLSGEVEEVEKTLAGFSVSIDRDPSTGQITHPALVYVLDAQGHIAYRFNRPAQGWLESAAASLPR